MKTEVEDDYQPLTVKEAIGLLSSLQPTQVLPALRHSDFVMLAGLAFQGFRMDAGGYSNPIVRRRLAEEAAKNHKFAEKLRKLAEEPSPPVQLTQQAKSQTPTRALPPESNRDIEKYRLERDRLKQERDAAVAAKQAAERQLTETKRELIAASAGKTESDREAERLKQRIERIERKQRQLETTNAALRRAAVLPPATLNKHEPIQPAPQIAHARHFVEAVRHLLGKDRESIALSLVNDVLRATPEDVDALDIKAEALIKIGKFREAVPVLRSAISLYLQHDTLPQAASALYRLLVISTTPAQETKVIRDFLSALARSPENAAKNAEPLSTLRIDSPVAFALVKSLAPPVFVQSAFPDQSTYAPDAALPLVFAAALSVTARKLVTAVDRNDQTIVELAQEALRSKEADEREKILASIDRAADGDTSYARVIAPKFSRGPIVVDTSNVAWHGQEMVADGHPRIDYVLSMRKTLRERGYFPVILIADANFPYVINDQALVRRMVDDEQIQLVISGSDADEQILREAMRLNACVVTNDYMADWDPDQKVMKVQYSFTPDGKPTVYF